MADIYTKTIFKEFQNEYVQSIKASIVGTLNDGESTIFTIRTVVDGRKDKNVIMHRDGFLSCSCKKFEVKGIVCRHCLKVLREILNAKDLPAQYILKRWTKKARAESVKDSRGYDVKADVKLHQSDRYRSLMNMFRAIASRAAESEETYHLSLAKGEALSVMVEEKLSVHTCSEVEVTELRNSSTNTCPQSEEVDCPIQAKGLKKRQTTSKGRGRIKGGMEKSIAKKKRMEFKQGDGFCTSEGQSEPLVAMGNICSQGGSFPASQGQSEPSSALGSHSIQGVTVYTPQGQSRPPFAMGSNYVQGVYTPQGQSQPPFAMSSNYVEGVYTPQGQSRPPFGISSNYVEGVYTPQGQSRPPFGMSSNYVEGNNAPQSMPPHSMRLVYPSQTSFQELLRGTSAIQLSQASYSPADSYVNGHPWKACTKQ